jgi:hypothetical protein
MERTKQIKRVSIIMIPIIAVFCSNQKRWKKYVNSGKSNLLGEELPISMCRISCSAVALKNLRLAVMKMYLDKLLCSICLSKKWGNHKNEWSRITFFVSSETYCFHHPEHFYQTFLLYLCLPVVPVIH